MLGKIILEEAWQLPRMEEEAVGFASPQAAGLLGKQLVDIQGRIAGMDSAGVEMQVLSFTSPGVQGITDKAEAEKLATEANEYSAGLYHWAP